MPVYYVGSASVDGDRLRIEGTLARHLRDVLRVQAGERLTFIDEGRACYLGRMKRLGRSALEAVIERRWPPAPPDPFQVVLGQALIKGERMDWVIQKATELGVSRIVPLVTRRTVIRLERERSGRRVERWRAIALEASQQSCRFSPPQIDPLTELAEYLAATPRPHLALFFYEHERCRTLKETLGSGPAGPSVALAVGPEGGFAPEEFDQASRAGWISVSLGPRVFRSETAALAALSILDFIWGGLASSAPVRSEGWNVGTP